MKRNVIHISIVAALLLFCGAGFAADSKVAATDTTAATPKPAANSTGQTKAVAPAKPIDINSASKAQLKKLPGIGDAEADKIIAGRPYGSKAWLVTHNIISGVHYEQIKDLIIARQK